MNTIDELFKIGKDPKTDKELIQAYVKAEALEKCKELHSELIKCYQEKWVPICTSEQRNFWHCYEQTSLKLRKKYNAL